MTEIAAVIQGKLNELGDIIADDERLESGPQAFLELLPDKLLSDFACHILQDDSCISSIAATAQAHPNSFRKITLASSPNGTKLVLHKWLAPTPARSGDLHSHRWNFVSRVLQGDLSAEAFEATRDPAGAHVEYSYGSASHSDRYPMVEVGRSTLSSIGTVSYRAGACYAQMHRDVHQASSGDDGALTLIVQSPPRQQLCQVFMPSDVPLEGERPVAQPPIGHVRTDVRELIGHLNGT